MKVSFLLAFLFLKVVTITSFDEYRENIKLLTYKLYWEHSLKMTGNFAFSPVSTQCALALAAIGAQDVTAKEIYKAVYLPNEMSNVTNTYLLVQQYLSSYPSFLLYNEIYSGVNNIIRSRYQDIAEKAFKAVITRDNPKPIDSSTLSSNVIMLSHGVSIGSRLYLNTSWIHNFWANTFMTFTHLNGTESNTEMVYTTTPAFLSVDTTWNANFIEFPFMDDKLSFTLVFTKNADDFPKFEKELPRVIYENTKRKVFLEICLPRLLLWYFRDDKSVLKALGLNLTFSEMSQFPGIADRRQIIESVLQGASLNISEIPYVEASSSILEIPQFSGIEDSHTIIEFVPLGAPSNKSQIPYVVGPQSYTLPIYSFSITRPFIYILRHKVLGILMMGRYV